MEENSKNIDNIIVDSEEIALPLLNNNIQSIPSNQAEFYSISYDLEKDKNVNYLLDYSKFLFNNQLVDDKILNWQLENSKLLHTIGINPDDLSKRYKERNKKYYTYPNIINQLEYRYGKFGRLAPKYDIGRNFSKMEKKIRKQIILQQRQKQSNEEVKENKDESNVTEVISKAEPICINNETKKRLEDLNFYNLDDPFIDDEDDKSEEDIVENTSGLEFGNYTEFDVLKYLEKNNRKGINISSKNNLQSINQTQYFPKISQISNENIIINDKTAEKESIHLDSVNEELKMFYRKFIETNNLPLDPKNKFNLIKKLINQFKKYKDDKEKLEKLFQFVAEKTCLCVENIRILFEFENLKNRKEGIFSSLSKTYNKLIQFLNEAGIKEIIISKITPEQKEKLIMVYNKSSEYLASSTELNEFILFNTNEELIFETYIPGFKSHKINLDDSKEKIIKKLKELLDKSHIIYEDNFFEEILKIDNKINEMIVDDDLQKISNQSEKHDEIQIVEIEKIRNSPLNEERSELMIEKEKEREMVFNRGNLPVKTIKYFVKRYMIK